MPAYLESIVAAHRAAAANDPRDVEAVIEAAVEAAGQALREAARPVTAQAGAEPGAAGAQAQSGARSPAQSGAQSGQSGAQSGEPGALRSFVGAIRATSAHDGMAVISEIKRRSPSKGDLDPDLDPAAVAAAYESGGAACLSVLTDRDFFGGCVEDLVAARSACSLPVLRKDFTVSALDVCDARTMGADAVLLIVAALSDGELRSFLALAEQLSLTALVEVHDKAELERALAAGARVVGVNQRDLRTFEVDRERALALAGSIPTDVVAVAESGIRDAGDVAALAGAGFQAVLVGETLIRSANRRSAIGDLLGSIR